MIKVVNNKDFKGPGYFIGRPSVLSNIFKIGVDGNRKEVIDKFEVWLRNKLKSDTIQREEIEILKNIAKGGDLTLICWCKPLRCHGDVIKKIIEELIAKGE